MKFTFYKKENWIAVIAYLLSVFTLLSIMFFPITLFLGIIVLILVKIDFNKSKKFQLKKNKYSIEALVITIFSLSFSIYLLS